jgi:hypothetical protein
LTTGTTWKNSVRRSDFLFEVLKDVFEIRF